MTPAGQRRHRIAVQKHNGNVVDGEPTYNRESDWKSFMGLVGLPAAYRDVTGGETVRGRQMEAHTNGLIEVLATPATRAIKPLMRVRMNGRTLYVVSNLDTVGDDRERMIQVSEQVTWQ